MGSRSTSTGTAAWSATPPIADSAAIRPDDWLTDVLGFPAFAVEPGAEVPPAGGRALWYAKVDVTKPAGVMRLEDQGFRVVDVNVAMRHGGGSAQASPGANVGPAEPDEHDQLVAIAGRCFQYSRFHLDPEIPDELANRVKSEWVRSYAEGRRGIELLAARDGDRVVGFLAVLDRDGGRVIDLVGVDPEHQGGGAGAALVAAFVERHGGEAGELLVGTQIANLPSIRLYINQGFTTAGATYVLHRNQAGP